MALTNIKLGDYIKRSTKNNNKLLYGEEFIEGVNNQGIFTRPKGSTKGVNLKPYKIIENGAFVYNPTRLNIGSIAYRTDGLCIVSHLYIVFYLTEKGKKIINPDYLFMYFRRKEFFREVEFRNFGSQRPEFSFKDMSEIIVPLPPLHIQNKYVEVYKSMLDNQKVYETGLEDLKLVCDATIDKLQKYENKEQIGKFIELYDARNKKNEPLSFKGLSMENYFIDSIANSHGLDFTKYKVVYPKTFAAVLMKVGRDKRITIAKNNSNEKYMISSAYFTFKTTSTINEDYLMSVMSNNNFDLRCWFNSDSSIRGSLEWNRFCEVEIPLPPLHIQQCIADIYNAYITRKEINEKLKQQIKDICPILIAGAIKEANAND